MEPRPQRSPAHVTSTLRHYLRVTVPNHRFAITKMLLSDHSLALERGRWAERDRPRIARNLRLCRFCTREIESPEHALFECTDSWALLDTRAEFLNMAYHLAPALQHARCSSSVELLHLFLANRTTTPLLAKLCYNVLQIYDAAPMHIAPNIE